MLPELQTLLEIQQLDKERLELSDQLRAYPGIWDEAKKKRDQAERAHQAALKADEDHEKTRRRIETEIRVGGDLLKRYESQVAMMRTHREIMALSSQIDQTKQRIAKLEEERDRLAAKDAAVAEKKTQAAAALEDARAEAETERERIRTQMRAKKERLEDIQKDLDRLRANLDKEVLVEYDRLMRRWPGSVVVSVHNGSCNGCFFAVLPHKLVELHREESIATCDNCGRIFSHDESYKGADEAVAGGGAN